jgi:beta-glucosidase
VVFPDFGSQTSAWISANAGLDLGSDPLWGQAIMLEGLSRGNLTEARLTDMAERNMMGYFYVGLDDGKQLPKADTMEYRDVVANHSDLIRQIGGEAIILLKNNVANGGGLPLNKPRTLALFGAHAGPPMQGPNQAFSVDGAPSDIYQGHLVSGGVCTKKLIIFCRADPNPISSDLS